jgi:redox-sensitive bicupin YhaK (pirin superfamily)
MKGIAWHAEFHLSISQPLSLFALWVLLPDSNRNMLGMAVMLLNSLKFIKEFN